MNAIRLLIAAAAASVVFAAPAIAKDRKVDVINKTGVTIIGLYASNVDETSWQENMLGKGTLKDGETVEADINDGTGACAFDLKAEFSDGDTVVERKLDVCKVGTFTFE